MDVAREDPRITPISHCRVTQPAIAGQSGDGLHVELDSSKGLSIFRRGSDPELTFADPNGNSFPAFIVGQERSSRGWKTSDWASSADNPNAFRKLAIAACRSTPSDSGWKIQPWTRSSRSGRPRTNAPG